MPYKTKGLEAYNQARSRHPAASTRIIPCREDILDAGSVIFNQTVC